MNKEDKQGKAIIRVLMFIAGLLTTYICNSINQQEKSYEYALEQEIGVSSNCYLKDGVGYCEVDNKVIRVDNYYEVE